MSPKRHLWLIRHAQSPGHSPSGLDVDRVLSERGIADCTRLAQWLSDAQPTTWLVTSAARRCVMTSAEIAGALGVPEDHRIEEPRLYEASESILTDVLQSIPADIQRAAIIAHNPAISMLVGRLLGLQSGIAMPPGSCVGLFGLGEWLDFRQGSCVVSASWTPQQRAFVSGSQEQSDASNLPHDG